MTAWGGLGRMQVQSGLGQPLRAEIEVTDIGNATADAFKARVASPETHRELAADYAGYLSQLRLTVEKRANGRAVIRVSSATPINEPFVSMVVELEGPSGKSYRKFTALIDPADYSTPSSRRGSGSKTEAASTADPAAATAARAEPRSETNVAGHAAPSRPAAINLPGTYRVRSGDSLSHLATRLRPDGSSTAQSMLALYRANPSAFIAGNPNALIAGRTLNVPSAETTKSVSRADAADAVKKWQGDWRQHALDVADAASRTPEAPATADAGKGKIAAAPPAATESEDTLVKDVLRLSRASDKTVDGKDRLAQLEEEAVMREQTLKNANARIAELEKQITEIKQKAPVAAPAVKPPATVPDQPDHQDTVLYGAGGAAALLLAGGLGWAWRRRRAAAQGSPLDDAATGAPLEEPAVVEAPSLASLVPEPEALAPEALIEDISDPIAEADNLVASGHEVEAETVLRTALLADPARQDIRLALLDLLANRADVQAFNDEAVILHEQTRGDGENWSRAAKLGLRLDPANPLYQAALPAVEAVEPSADSAAAPAEATTPGDELDEIDTELLAAAVSRSTASAPAVSVEDDFLAMLGEPAVVAPPPAPVEVQPAPAVVAPPPEPEPVAEEEPDRLLDFDFHLEEIDRPKEKQPDAPAVSGDLSLDLDSAMLDVDSNDPVSTKLDLAQVYFDMGDAEGAREILDEVMAGGSETQQAKAQALLAKL